MPQTYTVEEEKLDEAKTISGLMRSQLQRIPDEMTEVSGPAPRDKKAPGPRKVHRLRKEGLDDEAARIEAHGK